MTRWLGCGAMLVLAGSAWGADPCKAALKDLSKVPAATFVVESERLPYTHVTFAPDPSSDRSTWRQVSRFSGADMATWEGVDELTCEQGVFYLHSFTHRTPVGDVEDFHPPLPWSKLVLTEGDAWDWTGVLTVGPPGSDLRLVADARFEIGALEELKVPAGTFQVQPITYTLHVGGSQVVTTSWVRPELPWTLVKRNRTFLDTEGVEVRTDRWVLESLE